MKVLRWTIVLVVIALLVGACGGDDEADVQDAVDQAQEELDEALEDVEGLDEDISDLGIPSEDCIAVATALGTAAGAAVNGVTDQFQESVDALRRMSEVAPEDIADDFEVFAEALESYYTMLQDAGIDPGDPSTYSDPEAAATLEAAAQELAGAQTAIDNINASLEEICPTG